jgi:hypothetical protein
LKTLKIKGGKVSLPAHSLVILALYVTDIFGQSSTGEKICPDNGVLNVNLTLFFPQFIFCFNTLH